MFRQPGPCWAIASKVMGSIEDMVAGLRTRSNESSYQGGSLLSKDIEG